MKEIINTKDAPKAIGPYNQAIRHEDTLFISGQIAIDPATNLIINKNIADETHMIMKNIKHILKAANMDLSNIVKTSIFMKDINNYEKINNVYSQYFTKEFPAREALEVSKLPKNANVEISAIAIK
tara:strand:- start:365 stop:742 length:378 start_codon:yes stop_codon:yes gene_type:complete